MSILENIKSPKDVKKLNTRDCLTLSSEIREKIISTVEKNGGHLSSNLGIVETTVALLRTFDFPSDKLLFDVGHQCYAYKLLTGRYNDFDTIRTNGGISGFPDRNESEYDSFIAGHAGNSIGAGLGKCFARDKKGEDYFVIDVVGDGALINGLNLEALNANAEKPKKYIVILNDNGMSISNNKNGFYEYISEKTIGAKYVNRKKRLKRIFGDSFIIRCLTKIRDGFKRLLKFDNIFERLGFKYVGIFDGNDLEKMTKILQKVKSYASDQAVFLHIHTVKGKGYSEAENHADTYHGVGAHLSQKKSDFSECVGDTLNSLIEKDNKIVAITAGMSAGTGLYKVEKEHPDNFVDVGICEEYAVTLASGMASEGVKPFVCIYSTFLQRAYDEIMHDVCMQNLPVVFCIDRAGLVGQDGKTHQGIFDLSFLSHLPNIKIFAPKNTSELSLMMESALNEKCPVAIRYPSGSDTLDTSSAFNGEWETVKNGSDISILAVGPRMNDLALKVREKSGKNIEIINARVIKPLDEKTLNRIEKNRIITLEENAVLGGFSSLIKNFYNEKNKTVEIISYGIKDNFVCSGTVCEQLEKSSLTVKDILKCIK